MSDVLRVDPIACDGHGLCAELLPELIRLDDWGYPIVAGKAIPKSLLAHTRRAVDVCPTLALAIVKADIARPVRPGMRERERRDGQHDAARDHSDHEPQT
jgi:ferredoxin